MSPLSLPDPLVDQKPWEDERTGVQRNLDRIAQQFPLGPQHLQDDAVTQAKIADDAVGTDQIAQLPQVSVYHNAAQAIATGTLTALAFNSERYDLGTPSLNMHDNATNNSRLTCRVAGLHQVSVALEFAANATGYREVLLKLNGTTFIAYDSKNAANGPGTGFVLSRTVRMAVNDYVEVFVNHTRGANLDINSTSEYTPEFMAHWVSP